MNLENRKVVNVIVDYMLKNNNERVQKGEIVLWQT